LPDLRGKWLTAYAMTWAVMLALAIVGPIRSQYVLSGNYAKPAWQPYGFATASPSGAIQVLTVFSDEALRAGVRPGDRILAIDGWKVPTSAAALALARDHASKSEGSTTIFTLEAPGDHPRNARLAFTRRHFEDLYTRAGLTIGLHEALLIGSNLLVSIAFVASAVLLFVKERRKSVPAFLSLAFLIIGSTDWGSDWGDLGLSRTITALAEFAGWGLLLAALFAFPSGELSPRWTRVAILCLPLLLVVWLISHSDFLILSFLGAYLVAAAGALIHRYWALPVGLERQQLRWVFFGFVAGSAMLVFDIVGLLLSEQLQPTDSRWFVWNLFAGLLGDAGIVVIALGLMVSIFRYRLYDADTVIGRSAAYGVLTLGFVALFAGTEKLAEIIGERYFEHSIGIAAGAIGAAVAAAVVVPLHNRVHRWAERRFQKPLIRLREGLPECVADLRESAPVEQLVSAVMSRVEAGVRSTREAVLLIDGGKCAVAGTHHISTGEVENWQAAWQAPAGERTLDCDRNDGMFPMRVRLCIESGEDPETIGWLLLGPRPDGSFFGRDEREALAHVAGPVARAIHIAQLREQREEQAEKRLTTLELLIEKLASAVRGGPGTVTA
jgi:hypothetical protein